METEPLSDEQIKQLASAVAEKLETSPKLIGAVADAVTERLNGTLSGIRKDVGKMEAKIDGVATDLKTLRRELVGVVDPRFPPIQLLKEVEGRGA